MYLSGTSSSLFIETPSMYSLRVFIVRKLPYNIPFAMCTFARGNPTSTATIQSSDPSDCTLMYVDHKDT